MTSITTTITADQRRQLEELYRQQISAVRTLARLLGYPCPIAGRQERRATAVQTIDEGGTLKHGS
jgi:hypothetical protein